MKLRQLFFTGILLLSASLQAFSVDLREAKEQGLIGEKPNGYLGIVKGDSASEELQATVSEINAKRKEKYQEIARKTGAMLEETERLAGQKLISKTPSGQYVQDSGGQWIQK